MAKCSQQVCSGKQKASEQLGQTETLLRTSEVDRADLVAQLASVKRTHSAELKAARELLQKTTEDQWQRFGNGRGQLQDFLRWR